MILLASNSQDFLTLQPVIDELRHKEADVLVYLADSVVLGDEVMSIYTNEYGEFTVTYGDRKFSSSNIKAAWFRRPNLFSVSELDNVKSIYFNSQRRESQMALWCSIHDDRWLNPPAKMLGVADNKHYQMQLASQLGFLIPQTVTSNNWGHIFDSIKSEEIILKMPYGVFFNDNKENCFLATTLVKRSDRTRLEKTSPFPGIWQEYIPKKKEWRITVVGEKVFSVAIYTTEEARDDWRKKQFEKDIVDFRAEALPHTIEQKCILMLKKMGLQYGAFDIIERPDGAFVFIEVNLNGQYQWVVDELKLPIPQAIADRLLNIARNHAE